MLHEDEYEDDDERPINSAFPQARLDAMEAFAREFDARRPERWLADAAWDWTSHFDSANQAIFIARELELIRKGLYEIRYPELKSQRMIPHDTSVPAGVQDLTQKTIDVAGEPAISRDQPDEIPTVELSVGSVTMSFFNLVLAYQYSDQDADNAMFAGMPLQTQKAKAVRDQMARRLDKIAFLGESTVSVKGLFNQSGTTTYTVPATGTGGVTTWDKKDSDAILLDLNGLGDQVITDTSEVEEPDTWVLPLTRYRHVNSRRVGDGTSQTILKYFVENRDTPITVEKTQKLESNTGWTGKRMVAYKNDPSKLQLSVPILFRQKAPEVRGFKVRVVCQMRTGGVVLWIPKSVAYGDNI